MAFSGRPDSVVDTVVLMYFSMVDEVELMLELLGDPIAVPQVVFDPDEPQGLDDDARCEISRSIQYHRRVSRDPARDQDAREAASRSAHRIASVSDLHQSGRLVVREMTVEELELLGRLTSRESYREFRLRFPLDAGEAACLAIAVMRDLTLGTDDNDALTALKNHAPGHPYARIRRLLITAGEKGLCTKARANEIHREMRRLGFWDTTEPFPQL